MARPHLLAEESVAAMAASVEGLAALASAMDSRVAATAPARAADDARFSKWD